MKKFAIVLFVTMLVAGASFAQLDPDNDGIGVYFDPCACVNCLTLDVGEHQGFVVITHPTSPEGVRGWEVELTIEGPAFMVDIVLDGDGTNFASRPNEYIVGNATPQVNPWMFPAIVVAHFTILLQDTSEPVTFWMDGVFFHSLDEKVPAYLDGADVNLIKELQQSTGGRDFPVATINGECAVAVESASLDGVKALYR